MTSHRFQTSRSCAWNEPRRPLAEWERRHHHGPIQPMEEPRGWFARLFGRA